MDIVEVEQLTKKYGDLAAVDGISFWGGLRVPWTQRGGQDDDDQRADRARPPHVRHRQDLGL